MIHSKIGGKNSAERASTYNYTLYYAVVLLTAVSTAIHNNRKDVGMYVMYHYSSMILSCQQQLPSV